MRRNILCSIVAAALVPAASLWAAPAAVAPSTQYLDQITQETYQIQAEADGLEGYVRSGAHEQTGASAYAADMAWNAQKLADLLDQFAAQPGVSSSARQQVEKMKASLNQLTTFVGIAFHDLDTHAMPLHANDIYASTANIVDCSSTIRDAARNLARAN